MLTVVKDDAPLPPVSVCIEQAVLMGDGRQAAVLTREGRGPGRLRRKPPPLSREHCLLLGQQRGEPTGRGPPRLARCTKKPRRPLTSDGSARGSPSDWGGGQSAFLLPIFLPDSGCVRGQLISRGAERTGRGSGPAMQGTVSGTPGRPPTSPSLLFGGGILAEAPPLPPGGPWPRTAGRPPVSKRPPLRSCLCRELLAVSSARALGSIPASPWQQMPLQR